MYEILSESAVFCRRYDKNTFAYVVLGHVIGFSQNTASKFYKVTWEIFIILYDKYNGPILVQDKTKTFWLIFFLDMHGVYIGLGLGSKAAVVCKLSHKYYNTNVILV